MKTKRLLAFLVMVLLPMALMANPPKKVILNYNKETGKLNISAIHPVNDVNDHYIESFAISVNGEEIKVLEYTSQSSKESQNKEFDLPDLKPGDEISVKGTCNKFGSKTGTLEIK
jgi:hypothetical protein